MLERVKKTVNKYDLLKMGDHVLVSVSGGVDSTALLHILNRLKEEYRLKLNVFHLNHLFRGESAKKDALFVRELAEELGLGCTVKTFDVPGYCQREGLNAQEGARRIRYSLLEQLADEMGSNRIATGHQANDQAETVLINFLRGSGMDGLSGMEPLCGKIIRPLLEVYREELISYCQKHDLEFRQDPSNQKPVYLRNRLRLELIPLLESEYNSNFQSSLLRMAEVLQAENSCLDRQTERYLKEAVVEVGARSVSLDLDFLESLPLAIKRRLIRRLYSLFHGDIKGLTFERIEAVRELVDDQQSTGNTIQLGAKITVRRGYQQLIICQGDDQGEVPFFKHLLEVPGQVEIPVLGVTLRAKILSSEELAIIKKEGVIKHSTPLSVIIDGNKIKAPLVVRQRRSGDYFVPLGMKGHKKVKDYFIDRKLSPEKRDRVPLIFDQGRRLIWLAGHRLSEEFKLTSRTEKAVRLKMEPICC